MKKYDLIFSGDLHLCDILFSSHPGMKGDSKFLLSQLDSLSSEHNAGLVLLGDIFDKRFPSPYIISLFASYLRKHDFCYIVGQHDGNIITQWPDLLNLLTDNTVHHLTEDRIYDFYGFTITGFDYKPKGEIEEIIKKVPSSSCDILCCHQLLKQVWGQDGVWNLDLDWIKPNKIKFLALGDWHKTPNEGKHKGFYWAYTGSGLLRSIDEPLNKYCLGLYSEGSSLKVEKIPLKTRPVIYSEVRSENQLDKWLSEIPSNIEEIISKAFFKEGIPEEVSKPLVVLRFPSDIQGINQIDSVLKPFIKKADCFFHPMPWRPVSDNEESMDSKVDSININDIINEFVDSTTAPELHSLVSDLISSENPSEVITAFKRRRGIEDV